jgi:hypothetical protein
VPRTEPTLKGATGTTVEWNAAATEALKTSSHVSQAAVDHSASVPWSPSVDPPIWKASLTQELQQEQEAENAAAPQDQEEEESDEHVQRYKFVQQPDGKKREDITHPEGVKPTANSGTIAKIPADCSGPAVEESQETDVLQIPIATM